MYRRLPPSAAATTGLILALAMSPRVAAVEPEHLHIHHALHELRAAAKELKEPKHDFGGHREKALEATDAAIAQLDKALKGVGDNTKGIAGPSDKVYKQYKHHPHLHHALHELRLTEKQLKEAKHDYGGHREKALKDTHHAVVQIELALKHPK